MWDQYGSDYDQPSFADEPKIYLIASSPRSGSHFLGHLLLGTGVLGSPLEYLKPSHFLEWKRRTGTDSDEETLKAIIRRRTSPTGWFGFKAHWNQFSEHPTASAILPRIDRVIHVSRRDRIAQAISLTIANQTKSWISFHRTQSPPSYDFDAIRSRIAAIDEHEAGWAEYLRSRASTADIDVVYEDLLADPEGEVSRILNHFGLRRTAKTRPFPMPSRQATGINEEWRDRYENDLTNVPA